MYDRIIYQTDDCQWKVTVNVFNGVEYLHIRKYYLDFDENWCHGKDGVVMPLDLDNIKQLFIACLEILSLGESKQAIKEHFSELLEDLYV